MVKSKSLEQEAGTLREAVNQWIGVLGVSNRILSELVGTTDEDAFRKAVERDTSPKFISELATAINRITKGVGCGTSSIFTTQVVRQTRVKDKVKIHSTYTGAPIPTGKLIGSLQCKISVKSVVEEYSNCLNPPEIDLRNVIIFQRREWNSRFSPSRLLATSYAIVPFHGREEELSDLITWAIGDDMLGVRLYVGAGGMGKTRLAMEACEQLKNDQGFRAGFLSPEYTDSLIDYLSNNYENRENSPLFIVIDYAETNVEIVSRLLKTVDSLELRHIRIMLLARHDGDWWRRLKNNDIVADVIDRCCPLPYKLPPLALSESERRASYRTAARAFSEKLGLSPIEKEPEDFNASYFDRVLLLHMMALIDCEQSELHDGDSILDRILGREKSFWEKQIAKYQLSPILEKGFEQAMAIISGIGGVKDRRQAIELLKDVAFFKDQSRAVVESVADILHGCYPGDMWIAPIEPDLLSERLVNKVLREDPEVIFEHPMTQPL